MSALIGFWKESNEKVRASRKDVEKKQDAKKCKKSSTLKSSFYLPEGSASAARSGSLCKWIALVSCWLIGYILENNKTKLSNWNKKKHGNMGSFTFDQSINQPRNLQLSLNFMMAASDWLLDCWYGVFAKGWEAIRGVSLGRPPTNPAHFLSLNNYLFAFICHHSMRRATGNGSKNAASPYGGREAEPGESTVRISFSGPLHERLRPSGKKFAALPMGCSMADHGEMVHYIMTSTFGHINTVEVRGISCIVFLDLFFDVYLDPLIDSLLNWLIACLIDKSINWLIDWLMVSFIHSSIHHWRSVSLVRRQT